MERTCQECGTRLNQYNPSKFCFLCQKKISDALDNDKPYYDAKEMGKILGISEEQVRRKGRSGLIPGRIPGIKVHRYKKTSIEEWIARAGQGYHKPSNPVQEEAYKRCQQGDHSWLADSRFKDIAYHVEDASELNGNLISVLFKHTCYFCGHSKLERFC